MDGFHHAVRAVVAALAREAGRAETGTAEIINLFPGMVSPADLRHLRQIAADFGLQTMMLPDYSRTLDGELWAEYQHIPAGGTPVGQIAAAGSALASIELGHLLARRPATAATDLRERFGVPCHRLGLPIGIRRTDDLLKALERISRKPVPEKYMQARGRLLDALVDGHKYVNGVRAAVYGEADLVAGIVELLCEIGVIPVVCATGERGGRLAPAIQSILNPKLSDQVRVIEGADFVDIEQAVRRAGPELMIGHSKGYSLARKLEIPLVRIGFPVHDRVGGSRLQHLGYEGAQSLFDRIANTVIEKGQAGSDVGYTYM